MRFAAALLFFLAQPFWEAKPPEKWTPREIDILLHDSPWAQSIRPSPNVLIYLATAAPIEEAEAEERLRAKDPLAEPDPDYLDFLREKRGDHFALAIPYATLRPENAEEEKRMEEQTEMLVGRRTYKMVGHFPPTPSDPVLRLVFPREIGPADKSVIFRLYLPGVDFPDREVEFRIKDLMYHGKLAM